MKKMMKMMKKKMMMNKMKMMKMKNLRKAAAIPKGVNRSSW